MEAVSFHTFMLSPTAPVFASLADMSYRAMTRYQHSVSRTLDKTEPVSRKAGDKNSGQYVYASRLQSEVRRSKVYGMNLQSAISHYQTQDGFLSSAIDKYQHMSLLASKASNPLLTDLERDNLNQEFESFRKDIMSFSLETVNGNDVFRSAKKYQLVDKGANINWTDAKAEADALDAADPINSHYLATITTDYEQDAIAFQIGDVGINAWLGGNDTAVEGDWRWTEGPEGAENGGAGRSFWSGNSRGSSVNGAYQNWGNNEPNDHGSNEDYLQISQKVQTDGSVGKWNDLPDTNTAGATYQPRGYVIETDQGKLLGLLPQNSMDLENVSLVPFYTSSYINLNTLDDSVQAETTLRSTINTLIQQKGNIGSNISQLEMGVERLNRQIASSEHSFARMSDEEMMDDMLQVAKTKLRSDASMSVMVQARGISRNLTESLL